MGALIKLRRAVKFLPVVLVNLVPMCSCRAWSDRLSPRDCPVGSSSVMIPGAFRFVY